MILRAGDVTAGKAVQRPIRPWTGVYECPYCGAVFSLLDADPAPEFAWRNSRTCLDTWMVLCPTDGCQQTHQALPRLMSIEDYWTEGARR